MSGFCGSARLLELSLSLLFDVRLSETSRDVQRERVEEKKREKGKGVAVLSQPLAKNTFGFCSVILVHLLVLNVESGLPLM